MMELKVGLLLIIATYLGCVAYAQYIPTVPGNIPGSYNLSNSNDTHWACPIFMGNDSDGRGLFGNVSLIQCRDASLSSIHCDTDPVARFVLKRGDGPLSVSKGSSDFFLTDIIAQYFGNEVCVAWPRIEVDESGGVTSALCKSSCFTESLGPVSLEYSYSTALSSYTDVMYQFKFEASDDYKFIEKLPGNIPTSYRLSTSNSSHWACPIRNATEGYGDHSTGTLTVVFCRANSFNPVRCNNYPDSQFLLKNDGRVVSIRQGDPDFFLTDFTAQFFGRSVCLAWPSMELDDKHRVTNVTCNSRCFSTFLGPVTYTYTRSTAGYNDDMYKFVFVPDVASAAPASVPNVIFTLILLVFCLLIAKPN